MADRPAYAYYIQFPAGTTLLAWAAVADTGVVQYRVYGDGQLLTTTPGTFFLDTAGHTSYVVKVMVDGSEGPGQPAESEPCFDIDWTKTPPEIVPQPCEIP